jgi:uncharacterized protein YjbI with pentapeptide repeats
MEFIAELRRATRSAESSRSAPFRCQDVRRRADELPMSGGKPRKSADPLYLLLREGGSEEFNRRSKAGETSDLRGCDFRGVDLRGVDVANIDFSDCYFRQADLRGLDLRSCRLEGASLHAAHVSGAYFPPQLAPEEIEMSVRLGTRMRQK